MLEVSSCRNFVFVLAGTCAVVVGCGGGVVMNDIDYSDDDAAADVDDDFVSQMVDYVVGD